MSFSVLHVWWEIWAGPIIYFSDVVNNLAIDWGRENGI